VAALVAVLLLVVVGVDVDTAGARTGDPVAIAPDGIAYDINDRGVVVGYHHVDGVQRAFRWRRGGPLVDLGPGIASGVNDAGIVVGQSGGHAVRWTRDGTVEALVPGAVASEATDIDRRGTIVGNMILADFSSHAFILPAGATAPVELPVPAGHEGDSASVNALNDRGTIVGTLQLPTGEPSSLGLVWQGPSHRVRILPGTADLTTVNDVNERGVIVGSTLGGGEFRALVWTDPTRAPQDIGLPGTDSIAQAVNDRGLVVGVQFRQAKAFQWDPRTGRTTELIGADADHAEALAVNNHGVAVGYSFTIDPPISHASLLAPA
jgi:probable HAF family extracellular repeat protein